MKNRTRYIILFTLGVLLNIPLQAQNNPFKIDDGLYTYYMRCYKMIKDRQVLAMSDTLFHRAELKRDVKAQCLAWHVRCDHYYYLEDIPSLQNTIRNARRFIGKTTYMQYYFSTWLRLITLYEKRRWYGEALKEIQAFQQEAVRLNDNYGITMVYKHSAHIYALQRNYVKSLELYKKSAEYDIAKNQGKNLSKIFLTMGAIYNSLSEPDSAYLYYRKTLEVSKDPTERLNIYVALAQHSIYLQHLDTADVYIRKIESLREKHPLLGTTNDQYFQLQSDYCLLRKNYGKAMSFCDSIRSNMIKLKEKELIYKSMGNFEAAYKYFQRYIQLVDSTQTADNNSLLADLTSRFDNERLTAEKNHLKLQNFHLELEHTKSRQALLEAEQECNLLQIKNQNLTMEQQRKELEESHKEARYQEERAQMLEMRSRQNLLTAIVLGISLITVCVLAFAYALSRRRSIKRLKKEKNIAEQARQEAENANRLKSLFLQNMSHEIRTPLNTIVGFTGVLNSDEYLNFSTEERKEMLRLIETNTELLTTLINDILDLSKLESNTYTWNPSVVKVGELCHQVLASVAHRAATGVELRLEEPDSPHILTLDTDTARLQQVLVNFLTNACKYTEHGNITLAYHLVNDMMEFSVTDTGSGIPPEKVEKIFERFEKLDSFKQGTGLGLNICRRIAELAGGRVYVDATYTTGARFVFVHPIVPPVHKKENENEE